METATKPRVSEENIRNIVALNLKRRLKEKHMNQKDLAHGMQVDRSTVHRIIHGQANICLKSIARLSEQLEVEPAYFLKI